MDLLSLLNENYLFLVPALWAIGFALKKTPKVPDWAIIWVLFLLSELGAVLKYGLNAESLVSGIVAAGVAVFGHQLIKQTIVPDKPTITRNGKKVQK